MAADIPKNIGWVGLGIMGYPMADNLLKKLSPDTHFHVYDVSHESIDRFVGGDVDRVHPCASSKEVADKSVRRRALPYHICHQRSLLT